MTTEEAIKLLKVVIFMVEEQYATEEIEEALQMAIKALQAEPKPGKWIIKHGNYCGVLIKEYFCDQCGERGGLSRMLYDPEPLPNFCSNCGADMRDDDERGE